MNIVFLLMMTSLLVSQSLMDLMSFVIIITGLWCYGKKLHLENRPFSFFKIGLEKLWIAWIFIWFLGIILAPTTVFEQNLSSSFMLTRMKAFLELKWILNFYFFVWFFYWAKPWKNLNWSWLWWSLIVFSTYGIVGLIFDLDLIKQTPLSDPGRVGGLFDDPMTFAHVYSLFFILSLFVYFQKKDPLVGISSLLCGVAVFLSMTRGVWIGVFISLVISLFLYRKKLALLFLGATGAVFGVLFLFWQRFQDRILFMFDYANNYDSERVWLWKANLKIFMDHPILGIGYGQYKFLLREYYDILGAPLSQFESHAHNQYLHFLAGTGALGLLCFLIFVGFNLYWGWQLIRETKNTSLHTFAYGLFAAQISFLIGGMTESNFERAKVRWTYLVFTALALATIRSLREDSRKDNPV